MDLRRLHRISVQHASVSAQANMPKVGLNAPFSMVIIFTMIVKAVTKVAMKLMPSRIVIFWLRPYIAYTRSVIVTGFSLRAWIRIELCKLTFCENCDSGTSNPMPSNPSEA